MARQTALNNHNMQKNYEICIIYENSNLMYFFELKIK